MSLTHSSRQPNVALALQLMHEINEAKSLAYAAALANDTRTVEMHDARNTQKLAQCAAIGFPLHVADSLFCRETGRELSTYCPNGWSYISE